ncbi:uncharacterized protein LOC129749651 [Uranotaenia lowii]|uniref:uncharacterized protein LOC129749651 n=1 Tax=Uranotaenia lowii TaxID=190385 RepID=UPI002478FE2F|nr:uncharacterized protein LOC129749651 [Uranotaenia lowii]
MIEVEEVIVNEYEEPEMLMEEEVVSSPAIRQNIGTFKKVPVLRKPGEVITPLGKRQPVGNASTSGMQNKALPAGKHSEWSRVPGPWTKPMMSSASQSIFPKLEHMQNESHGDDYHDDEELETPPCTSCYSKQMERIESKLDFILSKLSVHDDSLKVLKYNIKDLRVELKNSNKPTTAETSSSAPSLESFHIAMKVERKRTIIFPISDDNYLLRLEELVQADENIRCEIISVYNEAPQNSTYDYLRKNITNLFENASKYTWTGKPPNNTPNAPGSNAACRLQLVEILISCCNEKFPQISRTQLQKEFRRALTNFNEARELRRRRKTESNQLMHSFVEKFDEC